MWVDVNMAVGIGGWVCRYIDDSVVGGWVLLRDVYGMLRDVRKQEMLRTLYYGKQF